MSPELNNELKIEGAKFPSAMAPVLLSRINRVQIVALVIGCLALAGSIVGAFFNTSQFFHSYLFATLFWLGLSLGCFLMTMIHYLTGGRWGYPTRRFLEASFMVLPLMVLLFIPIFVGLHHLYPWAQPIELAAEKVLRMRHIYLNHSTFIGRSLFFLCLWSYMAWCLRRWSLQQDATHDPKPTRKARTLSGIGIVIYCLLGTFAYVDWIMSAEIHWYSTMFVVIVIIGQNLITCAFAVIMLTLFRKQEPVADVVDKSQYHQLGNLLLAFVMFWAYVSFGQLLVIYSGDEPHELDWYLHRIAGHWKWVVAILGLFHFFLPFFLLLFKAISRNVTPLTTLAVILFVAHIFAVYWLVMPAFHKTGLDVSWLDFATFFGIGGFWLAFFLYHLKAAPLLPQHDPGLQFAFRYEP